MGFFESILYFGIPTLLLMGSILWFWPKLVSLGYDNYTSYSFSLGLINGLLLIGALIGYRAEHRNWNWQEFADRMRLKNLNAKGWRIALIATIIFGIVSLLINSLAMSVYKWINYSPPQFSPGATILWMSVINLTLNVIGEELWWRAYILPRQELVFYKWTWFINGTLWACFHMFKWYAVPFMLITCQIIPYVVQKQKNTWTGILAHFVVNGSSIILVLLGVF